MAKPMYTTNDLPHLNLAAGCPPVEGGTVSKTLLDEGPVKLILFAMDAGQELSEHAAPFAATVQVLEGRLTFGVGGQHREMTRHDWVAMPPNAPHDVSAVEPTTFLLTLWRG